MVHRGEVGFTTPVPVRVRAGARPGLTADDAGAEVTLSAAASLRLGCADGRELTVVASQAPVSVDGVLALTLSASRGTAARTEEEPDSSTAGRTGRHSSPLPLDRGDDPDLTVTPGDVDSTPSGRHRSAPAPAPAPAPGPAADPATPWMERRPRPVPATAPTAVPATAPLPAPEASQEAGPDETVVGRLTRRPPAATRTQPGTAHPTHPAHPTRPAPRATSGSAQQATEPSLPRPAAATPAGPTGAAGFHVLVTDVAGTYAEELDAALVIGRRPSTSAVRARPARPVTVTGEGEEVSQSHVAVRAQGGVLLVTDLFSTNGTRIKGPAHPPYRLRDGEEVPVSAGTVIELGDGVRLVVARSDESGAAQGVGHGA